MLTIVYLLYILLFVYAGLSKLLDFENFSIQLAQSPMLSIYAGWLGWAVPITELLIVVLLVFPRTRLLGLAGAFTLMVMFTTYIFIILNYASYLPCSCGGVLEKLGWREHLIFNLVFIFLAISAIYIALHPSLNYLNISKGIATTLLCILSVVSISIVTILFQSSENKMHTSNPFIRRYVHGVLKSYKIKLPGNAYYYAGSDSKNIYLGNYSNPLLVTIIDKKLQTQEAYTIKVAKNDLPSIATQLRVSPPLFYLIDGEISRILKGSIKSWKVHNRYDGKLSFSDYQIIKENIVVFKAYNSSNNQYALGYLHIKDSLPYFFKTGLLQKQVAGIFDIDGSLHYDSQTDQVSYTYYYRNTFLIMDSLLKLKSEHHTIDTIKHVQLQIDTLKNRKKLKLTSSLMVNPSSYSYGGHQYVRSNIKGLYEPKKTWEQTQTIDVYDMNNGNYQSSFYVYKQADASVRRFFIIDSNFYGFSNNYLVCYDINKILEKKEY